VDDLVIAGFVEVTNVDDGSIRMEVEDEEALITIELVGRLLLKDDDTDDTTPTLVEVLDDEGEKTTPALVELAITELNLEFVDALTLDVGIAEVAVDFVDAPVVKAETFNEVVLTTATLVDNDVPLTPFGEAGDQKTAGV
jgi:hypothetical protein